MLNPGSFGRSLAAACWRPAKRRRCYAPKRVAPNRSISQASAGGAQSFQAGRAELGLVEAEIGDAGRQRQPAHQRSAGLAHRRRGLDAVAALGDDPEQARDLRVEAADEITVADEGAQARPDARRTADGERGHLLDAINAHG